WRELPVPVWRACLGEIERVMTALLADPARPVHLSLPSGADADALGIAAFTAGMGPLLGFWIEEGSVVCDAAAASLLRLHLTHGRRRAERQVTELRAALEVLRRADICATVIKGAHTGLAYFPEAGTRPAADVDLVVDPTERRRAYEALSAAGYEPTVQRPSKPYKCEWLPPGMTRELRSLALAHGDGPFVIEMHDSLERVFNGVRTVSPGAVEKTTTQPFPALHPCVRVLTQPLLAAFLALHASEELHQLQLVRLLELVLVLRADTASGALRFDALANVLARDDAFRFAYPAFELAERMAPGTLDPVFHARLAASATPRIRRFVERLRPADAQRFDRMSLEERFLFAHGAAETARRAAYVVWPRLADHSVEPLHAVYARRLYRIVRGRISWRSRAGP
ncbi:MAG: nucleotidyltransferase family protein, partial [Longimicrobiales bacterium]